MWNYSGLFLAAVLFLLFALYLFACCACVLRRFRHRGRYFNYGLADLWAAIIGLTPSLALMTYAFGQRLFSCEIFFIAVALFFTQLAGIFITRMDYVIERHVANKPQTVLSSAAHVILGAEIYAIVLILGFMIGAVPYAVCRASEFFETAKQDRGLCSSENCLREAMSRRE